MSEKKGLFSSLFGGKKSGGCCNMEIVEEGSCCDAGTNGNPQTFTCCGNPTADGDVLSIKVLGAGCKSCHEQYENAKAAIDAMGLDTEVEYITDMQKVMEYGIMSVPAIVVNDKVVSMGKVLKSADVEKLLHQLGF